MEIVKIAISLLIFTLPVIGVYSVIKKTTTKLPLAFIIWAYTSIAAVVFGCLMAIWS